MKTLILLVLTIVIILSALPALAQDGPAVDPVCNQYWLDTPDAAMRLYTMVHFATNGDMINNDPQLPRNLLTAIMAWSDITPPECLQLLKFKWMAWAIDRYSMIMALRWQLLGVLSYANSHLDYEPIATVHDNMTNRIQNSENVGTVLLDETCLMMPSACDAQGRLTPRPNDGNPTPAPMAESEPL